MFDKFLARRNESFSKKVNKPVQAGLLQGLLRRFAQSLWSKNARHLEFKETLKLLDGKSLEGLDWEASLTKALLNEELLISIDAYDAHDQVVTFTYDLLGGYLIANEIISDIESTSDNFITSPELVNKLAGSNYEDRHPMHADILRCYQLLLPVKRGKHAYMAEVGEFHLSAIAALFEMSPKHIASADLAEITKLFQQPDKRKFVLAKASDIAFIPNHPLNALLSSRLVFRLAIVERDLSWSELLRSGPTYFESIVDALEKACRHRRYLEPIKDRLRLAAIYVAWMLTSTNRQLRDKATRALYWYGRRFPASFFRLTLASLRINDPYVSERMLAASYGVSMALHCRPKRALFRTKTLPAFARRVYEAIFAQSAPHWTTHALARDYAQRIIQLGQLYDSSLLGDAEQLRIKPPFKDAVYKEWQVVEDPNKGKYRHGNSPLGMDFENYTIGGLVPERRTYDYENAEYKKVLGQIIWRVYQLGYSLEAFGEIDKDIARRSGYSRSDRPYTERYGKKYAWIAYFELYGYRKDKGLLKSQWSEGSDRPSDIDIDPSFPDAPAKLRQIESILGASTEDTRNWVNKGPTPKFGRYLLRRGFDSKEGPWLLLHGYSSQRSKQTERIGFVQIQALLLLKGDEKEFVRLIKKKETLARLPDIEEDHYTFFGELFWSETVPHNEITSIDFVVGRATVPVSPDDPRHKWKATIHLEGLQKDIGLAKPPEFEEVYTYNKIPIYLPLRQNEFASSKTIERTSYYVPSKELAQIFGLWPKIPTCNMHDQSGKTCSVMTAVGKLGGYETYLYFKKELLDHLLSSQELGMVWVVSGERQHFSERRGTKHYGYKHFRQVYRYEGGKVLPT